MTWTLILSIVATTSGPVNSPAPAPISTALTSVSGFDTSDACEKAGQTSAARLSSGNVRYVCVPSSLKPTAPAAK
jgi:hypothetical protein